MKYLPRAAPAPTSGDLAVGPPTTMLPAAFNINLQVKARNKARSRAPRSRGFHPSELFGMCPVKYYLYDSSIENLASPDPKVIASAVDIIKRVLDTVHDGVRPGRVPQKMLADFHVGDAIHEWTQFSFGEAGFLWGIWKCPHCAATTEPGFMPRMKIIDRNGNEMMVAAYCSACKGGNHLSEHRQVKWRYVEPWMGLPEWELDGHCDGILLIPFKGRLVPFILEIKSINSNGYMGRYGDPLPLPAHVQQASQYVWAARQSYSWLAELAHVYFVYVNKDAVRDNKEFAISADMDVVDKMVSNMRTVIEAKAKDEIPVHARHCKDIESKVATTCPVVEECFGRKPPANLFAKDFDFKELPL